MYSQHELVSAINEMDVSEFVLNPQTLASRTIPRTNHFLPMYRSYQQRTATVWEDYRFINNMILFPCNNDPRLKQRTQQYYDLHNNHTRYLEPKRRRHDPCEPPNECVLLLLPTEIFQHIFDFLTNSELARPVRVCKQFNEIIISYGRYPKAHISSLFAKVYENKPVSSQKDVLDTLQKTIDKLNRDLEPKWRYEQKKEQWKEFYQNYSKPHLPWSQWSTTLTEDELKCIREKLLERVEIISALKHHPYGGHEVEYKSALRIGDILIRHFVMSRERRCKCRFYAEKGGSEYSIAKLYEDDIDDYRLLIIATNRFEELKKDLGIEKLPNKVAFHAIELALPWFDRDYERDPYDDVTFE